MGRAIWVAILAVAWTGCVPGPATTPSAGPRAFVDAMIHDFGEVAIGEEVRHVFAVENRGRQPLTLEAGRTECACTAVVSAGGTLAAGEAGWVEIAFDTTRSAGERVRTVTIETNDPETPEVVLTLRGRVVADVTVSPAKVFFGRVRRGEASERTVDVNLAPGTSVHKVIKESQRFELHVVRLAAPRSGLRLRVTLQPQSRPGPFDDHIVVTTSSERQPTIRIPVLGFVE